jgi:hypothetical protein
LDEQRRTIDPLRNPRGNTMERVVTLHIESSLTASTWRPLTTCTASSLRGGPSRKPSRSPATSPKN